MARAFSLRALPLERFFGADALRQPVILTVMGLLSINRLMTVIADQPDDLGEYARQIAIMGFIAWAVFSLLGLAVNHIAPHTSLTRAALVFTTYIATGFSREILLASAPGSTVTFVADPTARLATALITSAVMFPLVAGFVGDARRYSESVAETKSVKTKLAAAHEWSEGSLATNRESLVELVQKQLHKAFAPFIESRVHAAGDVRNRTSELARITQSVVKPLSARLTQSAPNYRQSDSEISPVRVSIVSTLDLATRTNPFRPGLYIWAIVLIDAPVFITTLNWTERFWALVVLTALGLIHLAARHIFLPYISKMRFRWRMFVVGVVYNLSLLPISVFMFVVLGGTTSALWAAGFSFVLGWVFFGVSAAMSGFALARQFALSEFDEAAKLLEWKIARINCQAWIEQRNLATFLHGEVQSLILVAQLRIQRAIDANEDVELVVAEVQDLLRDIPTRIGVPPHGATLELFGESLSDRWGTFIELQFEFTEETRRAINADSICLAVAREILTEFVVNAVTHGRADDVHLALNAKKDRIELRLTNNRVAEEVGDSPATTIDAGDTGAIPKRSRFGVGSELVDSVLLDKQLTVMPTEYRLSGAIPLVKVGVAANTRERTDAQSAVS